MSVTLNNMCCYCERSIQELQSDDSANSIDAEAGSSLFGEAIDELFNINTGLTNLLINSSVITLCQQCREQFAPDAPVITPENYTQLAPITFPPGITSIEHHCPQLDEQILGDDDASFVLELQLQSDGRYYAAQCPHCQVRIRSLAVDPDEA
jgi:hypothetical protein